MELEGNLKLPSDTQKIFLLAQAYQEPSWIDQSPAWPANADSWLARRRRELAKLGPYGPSPLEKILPELTKKEGGEEANRKWRAERQKDTK
jgi:hypothetical protein